jgi:hypothetical protein
LNKEGEKIQGGQNHTKTAQEKEMLKLKLKIAANS